MWISKEDYKKMISEANAFTAEQFAGRREAESASQRLVTENTRLRSDIEWFKHRLNQVERERAQLIAAAIGVKIAVPEFVPTAQDPASLNDTMNALQELYKGVGEDSADDKDDEATSSPGVDYRNMPGYRRQD
jgi:hypothetical protein